MPPCKKDAFKYFDAMNEIMFGACDVDNIEQFQAHVVLYEEPDVFHPIQFYYWVSKLSGNLYLFRSLLLKMQFYYGI